jgi:hypothetical protein
MLGKRKVGSNGVMVRSYVRRPVILGSVDEAGRQCGPGAGIGKYDGFCAECREHLEVSGSREINQKNQFLSVSPIKPITYEINQKTGFISFANKTNHLT